MTQRWHAGMSTLVILDQLSKLYGHSTLAVLKQNNKIICNPYLATNPPEVLFRCIQDCAKIALLGCDPYTDHQLTNNTIHLLLTMGLYLRPFKDWDCLLPQAQTWLVLRAIIQEFFQRCLNTTAPTIGHHGYASAMPFQQNAFCALAENNSDDKFIAASIAMQVVALTHKSQITSSTVTNTSQHHDQKMTHIASQQDLVHQNMHQIIAALNTVMFNASNEGRGIGHYARGQGPGCARQARGCGSSPPMYAISGRGFKPGAPMGRHMAPHVPMAPPMIAPVYRASQAPYPPAYSITGTVNANIQ
jgi:hypothetical protein